MKPTPQESFSFSFIYNPWFAGSAPAQDEGSRWTALKLVIFSGDAVSETRGRASSGWSTLGTLAMKVVERGEVFSLKVHKVFPTSEFD
jgi:hypothetical protein